ncbi:class I adenylate-forming enzyme family protein [Magnetospirillum gryphiswaldense]|uniref:class I adenylate-forming enzyme family protein n=1 Tax=Magnetospirillum gryphiswaldense TaxID=55518 RepID=UPI000D02E4F5|nr:class I adenylate-forming enzyme family protein [Magnetospirillum gryphiswaldense]AVM76393.1 Long-chain-fatty-acid--CoA ligase [Magnetospirillum gryphiswaldense MSR-1]AVM80296.1 Long-chain-fatty-acid--CoA ligase [Magnetospirillum gryphiswaldense]
MPTIIQRFLAHVRATPDKIALVFSDQPVSYADLAEEVRRLAAGLTGLGVGRGSRVLVLLKNCRAFAALMLAAAERGAVIVPVSAGLRGEALVTAFTATECQFVVGHGPLLAPFAGLVEAGKCVSVDGAAPGCCLYDELLVQAADDYALGQGDDGDDLPYILTMTSGSTGAPKPIIFSQATKIARAQSAVDCYGLTANDVVLAATPLYHSLAQRLVLMPLMFGMSAVVLEPFTPAGWMAAVERWRVSFTIPVSSQLSALLPHFLAEPARLASLRVLVSSSAQIAEDLKRRLAALLACQFHEIYGASEVGVISNLSPDHPAGKMASVGLPLAGIDLRILGDDGAVLPVGEIGEIACRTPTAFLGYYNRPDATVAAWCDGYFRTGDLGWVDADGFLYFSGRKKDLVISGGINIYPIDIERVLMGTGLLADCAAIGLPDSYLGEAVLAVVVPKEAAGFDLRPLRRACVEQLADYQQPLDFAVVTALPKNALGKTVKPELQERFKGKDLSARLRGLLGLS